MSTYDDHAQRYLILIADAGSAGVGRCGSRREREPLEVIMAAKRPDFEREWS